MGVLPVCFSDIVLNVIFGDASKRVADFCVGDIYYALLLIFRANPTSSEVPDKMRGK
jgi:hypothetical protein